MPNDREKGFLRLAAMLAATPDVAERTAHKTSLERVNYECAHGPGSYQELVTKMMNAFDNASFMLDGFQDMIAAGTFHEELGPKAAAEDTVELEYAGFVVYSQATRAELEVAAKKIGIPDLDEFLLNWRPATDKELGLPEDPSGPR